MEQMRLTKILEGKDDLDTRLIRGTINMMVGLDVDKYLFPNDKKLYEEYFGYILNIAESLCKANSHRRKYLKLEKKTLNRFRRHSLKNQNTVDIGMNPIELNTETDGLLSHVKAALDSYAKSLGPLLGIKLDGWHKVKKESGVQILKSLENNLSDNLKEKAKPLKEFIESNIQWVSYIVFLRDSAPHHGGIKNITEIIFQQSTKKVVPQMIHHSETRIEKVSDFLNQQMADVSDFFNALIALSLLVRSPFGGIVINEKDDWPPYRWVIVPEQLK